MTSCWRQLIEAAYTGIIYQLGNWDGTTYTPPTDIITPFDPTAAGGDVQEAAHKAEDVFDNALELIDDNENAWTDDQKTKGREGIYWQRVNMARVCLNATRPAAERIKWCEECASWPTDTNGNVREYVDAFGAGIALATKDFSWVGPASPFTRVDVMLGGDAI